MKFAAVILLACVAASSAAFTGNLVEQTKPVIDRAIFGLRLAVSSNANEGLKNVITEIINNLQDQLNQAILHVQNNVMPAMQAQLQAQVEYYQAQLANALAVLHGQVTGSLTDLLAMLGLGQGTKAVSLTSIIAQLNEMVAAAQFHIANAQEQLATFLTPEKIRQMLMNAINQIVPASLRPDMLTAFGLNANNKGPITDMVSGFVNTLWEEIMTVINSNVQSVVDQIQLMVQQAMTTGGLAMMKLKAVLKKLSDALKEAQITISAQTAIALQTIIRPALENLGDLGTTLMAQLSAIIG